MPFGVDFGGMTSKWFPLGPWLTKQWGFPEKGLDWRQVVVEGIRKDVSTALDGGHFFRRLRLRNQFSGVMIEWMVAVEPPVLVSYRWDASTFGKPGQHSPFL